VKQPLPQPAVEAAQRFPAVFQDDGAYASPLGAAWASGRVNIIGEHTDYNEGLVLPAAVSRVVAFAGRRRNDLNVRLWSEQFQESGQFTLEGLPENFAQQRDAAPKWVRYVMGVASELIRAGIELCGFDAVVTGDVPLGGGMSSSSALVVASAQAYALFSDGKFTIGTEHAKLTPMQLADLCAESERRSAGLNGGILDQAASCLGQPGKAVLIDCRSLDYRYIPFDAPDLSIVVIDTNKRRELTNSGYNDRTRECREAWQTIKALMLKHEPENPAGAAISSLRDVTPEIFAKYQHELPEVQRKRAGYVIAENERVLQVVALLEKGDHVGVGQLLWEGHAGLRDEYEVSCKELDVAVEIARSVPGVLGARMMGGGFGGCTINIVRNEAVEALREAIEQHYEPQTGLRAGFDICNTVGGPGYTFLA